MFLAAVTLGNKICSVRFGIGKCSPFSIYKKKKKNVFISTSLILLVFFDCGFFPVFLFLSCFFLHVHSQLCKSGVLNSYFFPPKQPVVN